MLDRVQGRIIKLIDAIRSRETDNRKQLLDEKKYKLAVQKLTGEYVIEPDIDDFA